LTALGIGSTLGLGIYVLIGEEAFKTGPSIIIAFLLAGIASLFAGLCYAEFGARVPRAGSAYVYSYVTVGEFIAFIIGWNLVLEYAIGTSSVAKGYSVYLDSLLNNATRHFCEENFPISLGDNFSNYFDIVSFAITMFLTVMLCFGVRESTAFNSIFTIFNVSIVIFVTIIGSQYADISNWTVNATIAHEHNGGEGGFLPHGFAGLLAASASCFYFFIGFDVVATSGEEAKNPSRNLPLAIIMSLTVVFLAYCSVSTVQTLMQPYYEPLILPEVFANKGIYYAKWIIVVGGLAGLSSSLIGAIYPLPRVLYSMAVDGLVFRFLSKVHEKTRVPVIGTLISGFLAGLISAVFNLRELADMMSIGTLLAYTLVALSVIILRYRKESNDSGNVGTYTTNTLSEEDLLDEERIGFYSLYSFRNLLNQENAATPTTKSSYISSRLILILTLNIILFDASINFQLDKLQNKEPIAILLTSFILLFAIFFFVCLSRQPMNTKKLSFEVPFVPLIPMLSVTCNILLMFNLSGMTWVRFAVWMTLGFLIYFFYGIKNSSENSERVSFLSNNRKASHTMEQGIVNNSMTSY